MCYKCQQNSLAQQLCWMGEVDEHPVFLAFVLPRSNKQSCLPSAMTLTAIQSQFDIFPMVVPLLFLQKLGGSEGRDTLCPEVLLTFENNALISLFVSRDTPGALGKWKNHTTQLAHPFSKISLPGWSAIKVSGKRVSSQIRDCAAFREGEYRC